MAVAMLVDNPEGTQEIYEECESGSAWRRLPEASSTSPGRVRNGDWRVIEVWDPKRPR